MILRIGQSGKAITQLQTSLNRLGESLKVDGYYGPRTEAAIQRFQAAEGLPVCGTFGPITEQRFNQKVRLLPATPVVPPTPLPVILPVSPIISTGQGKATVEVKPTPAPTVSPVVDDRSAKNIATLLPAAQGKARDFVLACLKAGIPAKIISALRTYEEQDALYVQGRTAAGDIVTHAKAGQSWHNFGVAWDIGIFDGDKYLEESPLYDKAGEIGQSMGLTWGGDWKGKKRDAPHYQLQTGYALKDCRDMVEEGEWPPPELKAVA